MNTAQRINTIARQFRMENYLEIGVEKGITFRDVMIERKTAVDIDFRFDYQSLASPQVKFYAGPSDDFFRDTASGAPFDLIFIDGLHHFEQVFRDFTNALARSHDQTIIIVDDVFPVDVFSSLRSNSLQARLDYDPQSERRAWHGDVFRFVFMLNQFFPAYSYSTTRPEDGNPQTYIYRSPRTVQHPPKSLLAIEHMNYFELLEERAVFNFAPEVDVLREIAAFLSGAGSR